MKTILKSSILASPKTAFIASPARKRRRITLSALGTSLLFAFTALGSLSAGALVLLESSDAEASPISASASAAAEQTARGTDFQRVFGMVAKPSEKAELERLHPEVERAFEANRQEKAESGATNLNPLRSAAPTLAPEGPANPIADLRSAGTQPPASISTEPGSMAILWSMGLPEADDRELARDAARLGIPIVLSGLPVKAREPAQQPSPNASPAARAPLVLDRDAAAALGAHVERLGVSAAASPEIWHAVRDKLDHEPMVPALVIFGSSTIELFPGSVRPLWTLSWAAEHAESEDVREFAKARIEAAGLEREARLLKP